VFISSANLQPHPLGSWAFRGRVADVEKQLHQITRIPVGTLLTSGDEETARMRRVLLLCVAEVPVKTL
jgi:hypothetical protein